MRTLAVILPLVVMFVAGEVALRMLEPRDSKFEFIDTSIPSPLSYRLRPGSTGELLGYPITVNQFGIRGEDFEVARQPDTVRVIALGDSMTMSPGVPLENTYPARLEKQLNANSPESRHEVLNFGVWGYNTEQQQLFFEEKGIALQPDVVVLGFFPNDADAILPVGHPTNGVVNKLIKHSFVLRVLKPYAAVVARQIGIPVPSMVSRWRNNFADDSPTWKRCQASLRRMKTLSQEHDFDLKVVLIPVPVGTSDDYPLADIHTKVAQYCESIGITVHDATPAFRGIRLRSLWVCMTDGHLNSKGNAILASFVAEQLKP